MDVEEELRKETLKWLERIRSEEKDIRPAGKKGEGMIKNIRAYVDDCEYFLKSGDLVRAFESVVWAWSWLEILRELGMIRS